MFRISYGLSVLFLSILWLSLDVQCRELDDIVIRRAVRERNDPQSRFRRSERLQREKTRYGKFEERMTLMEAMWFIGNKNNSFVQAAQVIKPDIETFSDFRMLSRDFRGYDLNSRLERGSRMRLRDSREVLFSENLSFRDGRSSERRVREGRMILDRRTDRIRTREVSLRRSQERRTFEQQRMLSRNRDSNRMSERLNSLRIDSSTRSRINTRGKLSGSRKSSVEPFNHGIIFGFLELCYVKMKENLTTILLSFVFLLDFINELVLGKKNAKSMLGKSAIMPDMTALSRIF